MIFQKSESCLKGETMKKLIFLLLLISAFFTVMLFAEAEKTEKKPEERPSMIDALSAEELDAEINKGYYDMIEGGTEPVKKVFDEIRSDYE